MPDYRFVDGFDGSLLTFLDAYRAEKFAQHDDLQTRVSLTRTLGEIFWTDDLIARERLILETISVRNQTPFFHALYLNFLMHPEWVDRTDVYLTRLRAALPSKRWRHVVGELLKYRPRGALFEVNVYGRLSDVFSDAEPEPALPQQGGQADVRVTLAGRPIYIEDTVIGETQFLQRVGERAIQGGIATWTGDPYADAFDVVRRLVSKARQQTALHTANIICVSFADGHPFDVVRQWAFDDLLSEKRFVTNTRDPGGRLYLTDFHRRVDSVFEFNRDRFVREYVNPHALRPHRLSEEERAAIRTPLAVAPFMIR
jgi:hypothetical protein